MCEVETPPLLWLSCLAPPTTLRVVILPLSPGPDLFVHSHELPLISLASLGTWVGSPTLCCVTFVGLRLKLAQDNRRPKAVISGLVHSMRSAL